MPGIAPGMRARRAFVPAVAVAAGIFASSLGAQGWETGTDGLRPIPPLSAHVTDLTHTLSATERAALEAKLADWEARTTNQLAVLIVPTTQPEPIEAYSLRVAEKWKVGRKGNDNGVLFTIAKDDRKMRFEVGYGLEGTMTDATSRRIIAENVAPYFREGKFAAGIDAGVDRVIEVVAEGKPLPPPPSSRGARPAAQGFDFGTMLLLLLVVVPLVGRLLRGIFGRFVGSAVGGGVVGAAAWFVAGSVAIAILAGIVGFIVMIVAGAAPLVAGRRGGVFLPGGLGGGWGGGGGGWSGGGGGWSGGGGTFGGGGASGGWD